MISFKLIVCLLSGLPLCAAAGQSDVPWPVNGGADNIRYSPLTQINQWNIKQLQVAWTYDSGDAFKGSEMQSNPIIVDGLRFHCEV